MTGTLQVKTLASGKAYYYVKLSFKEPKTGKWKSMTLATGLEERNNKRKAEAMIGAFIEKYAFLEKERRVSNEEVNHDMLLSDYLELWLDLKQTELRTSTFDNYSFKIEKLKEYFEPKKTRIVDVTPQVVDTCVRFFREQGGVDQKTRERKPLAVRTVRDYKNLLSGAMSQAVIDGVIPYNPVQGVKVRGRKNAGYSEELLFLTEEEVAELLAFIAEHHPRLLGITFFGAYYGLRRSEIIGLKWDAIDTQNKKIHIQHTVIHAKTIYAEDATKTFSSRRTLNLFDTAEKCLERIRAEQEQNRTFYGNTYANKDGYVFTWEDGTLYDPSYISKAFCKATKAFGRPEITLHKLRHTCASMLINRGWDVKRVQYWLGHADVQTTLNIYAHFNRQRLNESENDLALISKCAERLF